MIKIFDAVGRTITSIGAVIFVMLLVITGMVFFSHTLFMDVFPDSMERWEKLAATWLMACGWEFKVLLTTCNTRHINSRIPALMAIASGFIVLFFLKAFDSSESVLTLLQRWFVGVLAATINYIYAELFYSKWKERTDSMKQPDRLAELQSNYDKLVNELNEVRTHLADSESVLAKREARLDEQSRELIELRSFKKRIDAELECPHCKVVQPSHGTLNAHKGHCPANPKNKAA